MTTARMKELSYVITIIIIDFYIAYILTAVIVIDVVLAMLFLIWDMYKKLKKISLRMLALCSKFKNMIKPDEPKKQQQNVHSE